MSQKIEQKTCKHCLRKYYDGTCCDHPMDFSYKHAIDYAKTEMTKRETDGRVLEKLYRETEDVELKETLARVTRLLFEEKLKFQVDLFDAENAFRKYKRSFDVK